ncbi:MAG TPA: fumarylacetoacetate hydrolase family protein [Solirubrobacterales bacterium]|nr:fumarylacetoacetate hydrolase family protein [Solirubrobacterales bacterium]
MSAPATVAQELALRLDRAWEERAPIRPLSETDSLALPEDAYEIQRLWTELRRRRGDRSIGHKIGLTSAAMREQLGVYEPDYGCLWESRFHPRQDAPVEIPHDRFIQPRVEGELAFLMARALPDREVDAEDVLAATAAVAVAIEVIDSRIENWRIQLVDTIADNASYGAVALGPWSTELAACDLRRIRLRVSCDETPVTEGRGEAALGNPARCVAWLANKLRSYDSGLAAGDVVLSGALAGAVPASRGQAFTVEVPGQPALTAVFA